MSIFVALLFQVLFVLFAMVVNIGMLVHDKINLQNAVDFAAYYGAQRQAEILNEIAHLNYQIRQDYKLLAWRYNVVGTLGRQGINEHTEQYLPPARKRNAGSITEQAYNNPVYTTEVDKTPAVCVSNQMWSDMLNQSGQPENYCYLKYGTEVPPIPDVVKIAPFVPLVGVSEGFTKQAQEARRVSCAEAGPRNWAFAIQMFYAYKQSIAIRKSLVWELRKNLVDPDFVDRENQKVKEGVLKTLMKNLTKANESSFDEGGFEVLNGLSLGQCAQGNGAFTIQEVLTAPTLLYVYNQPSTCAPRVANHQDIAPLEGRESQWDPNGAMKQLANGEPEPTSPLASSLGFEKNPWCMAYYGVKARTRPYKPFAPFGSAVTIEARGFAQPFGGRVGPWYKERWTRGADKSANGERVDKLTTPRLNAGALDSENKADRLLNYSRYPGDELGLKSVLTLGAQRQTFLDYENKGRDQKLRLKWFSHFDGIPKTGDPLASDGDGNPFESAAGPLRRAEVAAVAPDLFDATYYSVDPKFFLNYAQTGQERFSSANGFGGNKLQEFQDLGGKFGEGDLGKYSVEQQIKDAREKGFDQAVLPNIFYALEDWTHLLTAWAPHRVTNYQFPEERFARCSSAAKDDLMIPGKCIQGGRVGYSVRLISRAALNFSGWKIGGEGEGEGTILNPPESDF